MIGVLILSIMNLRTILCGYATAPSNSYASSYAQQDMGYSSPVMNYGPSNSFANFYPNQQQQSDYYGTSSDYGMQMPVYTRPSYVQRTTSYIRPANPSYATGASYTAPQSTYVSRTPTYVRQRPTYVSRPTYSNVAPTPVMSTYSRPVVSYQAPAATSTYTQPSYNSQVSDASSYSAPKTTYVAPQAPQYTAPSSYARPSYSSQQSYSTPTTNSEAQFVSGYPPVVKSEPASSYGHQQTYSKPVVYTSSASSNYGRTSAQYNAPAKNSYSNNAAYDAPVATTPSYGVVTPSYGASNPTYTELPSREEDSNEFKRKYHRA